MSDVESIWFREAAEDVRFASSPRLMIYEYKTTEPLVAKHKKHAPRHLCFVKRLAFSSHGSAVRRVRSGALPRNIVGDASNAGSIRHGDRRGRPLRSQSPAMGTDFPNKKTDSAGLATSRATL